MGGEHSVRHHKSYRLKDVDMSKDTLQALVGIALVILVRTLLRPILGIEVTGTSSAIIVWYLARDIMTVLGFYLILQLDKGDES